MSDLHLFWLQEVEEIRDKIRKEMMEFKHIASTIHKEIVIKHNEIEVFQDIASYFKHENKLREGKIASKTEEISSLNEESRHKTLEEKRLRLEVEFKNETEILLVVLKEKR